MTDVKEGNGIIESKTESVTKKGDKFWKFKIDGKTYSLFEFEAGREVEAGDQVKMFWTETEGAGQFGAVTYRNLNSIFKEADTTRGAVGSTKPASEVKLKIDTSNESLKEIAIQLARIADKMPVK